MLNSIKKQSGFTIVELLIVIVVIAILAAISIVAYNGIQNRGKASAAQSLGSQISKKAEAYNTIESSYPANVAGFGNGTGATGHPKEAKLDDSSKVTDATGAASAVTLPSDEKTVAYRKCAAGAQVYWYNASTSKVETMGIGGASSGGDTIRSGTPTASQVLVCS